MKLIITLISILLINLSYSQCNNKLDTVYYYNQMTNKVEETVDLAYSVCYTDTNVKIFVNNQMGYTYRQNEYYIHIFQFKKLIISFWREEFPIDKHNKL